MPQKLGIKEAHAVALIGAPPGFTKVLGTVPTGAGVVTKLGTAALDVIVFFTKQRAELTKRLPALRARMAPACGLWIAWPKKASGVATDMTEDVIRQIALPTGLVDNKVCAIDDTWSGLRLVIRKELR